MSEKNLVGRKVRWVIARQPAVGKARYVGVVPERMKIVGGIGRRVVVGYALKRGEKV